MFVCWSHQEDFRHLSFQGWRTADSGGTLSDWNVFVPKGHLQFPNEDYLNGGIWVRVNGHVKVLRTRIIHDNTAPYWAKENIHFDFFFLIKNDWPGLFLSVEETRSDQQILHSMFPHYSSFHKNHFWSVWCLQCHESASLILVQKLAESVYAKTDLL